MHIQLKLQANSPRHMVDMGVILNNKGYTFVTSGEDGSVSVTVENEKEAHKIIDTLTCRHNFNVRQDSRHKKLNSIWQISLSQINDNRRIHAINRI